MTKLPANHQATYWQGDKLRTCPASELTPLKAVRAKCMDCSAGSLSEVAKCAIPECPLFAYRMGHRPMLVGIDSGAPEGHLALYSSPPDGRGDTEHHEVRKTAEADQRVEGQP